MGREAGNGERGTPDTSCVGGGRGGVRCQGRVLRRPYEIRGVSHLTDVFLFCQSRGDSPSQWFAAFPSAIHWALPSTSRAFLSNLFVKTTVTVTLCVGGGFIPRIGVEKIGELRSWNTVECFPYYVIVDTDEEINRPQTTYVLQSHNGVHTVGKKAKLWWHQATGKYNKGIATHRTHTCVTQWGTTCGNPQEGTQPMNKPVSTHNMGSQPWTRRDRRCVPQTWVEWISTPLSTLAAHHMQSLGTHSRLLYHDDIER